MIYRRIARLNANGSTDTSFDVGEGANDEVLSVGVRSDGKVLIGGVFTVVDDRPRSNLALLETDGSLDLSFDMTVDDAVRTIAAQADGRMIFAGDFETVDSQAKGRCARLAATGELEPSFDPGFNGPVWAVAGQDDGKLLAGGDFSLVGSSVRDNFVRLLNDAAQSTLTVQSASQIFWERAGTAPETYQATFELSIDGGTSYTLLGQGVSAPGGWTITGLTLTGDGMIRARAYPPSGSSEGIVEEIISFDFVPEIQVEQPVDTVLVDNVSTVDFGEAAPGSTTALVFTIRNIGLDDLELTTPTQVALSGTNANQWSLVAQPATPVTPQGISAFTLTFSPTSTGSKVAVVTILSDDADEGTFTVNLTGEGIPGPGARDLTYQPVANNTLQALAVDASDRATVGGLFTTLNGVVRNRVGRLLVTGLTDTTLTGTGANNTVRGVIILSDGSTLVYGDFTTFNGTARRGLAKFLANGSLDTTFNAKLNGSITTAAVQADGKILIAGSTTLRVDGVLKPVLARLFSNGLLDTGFTPSPISITPHVIMPQADGTILCGTEGRVFRMLSGGALDGSFNTTGSVTSVGPVFALNLLNDGGIMVGGSFSTIAGVSKADLARLSNDGTVDAGFSCDTNGYVACVNTQADGRTVVAGQFSTLGGEARVNVGRALAATGVDESFASGFTAGSVAISALQDDGKVLVGGSFTLEGSAGLRLARLGNDAASESLSVVSNTQTQWLRGGSMPEALWTEFQYSQDSGSTWTNLGVASRITGGWSLTGISLPISGILRGLARVIAGKSFSLLESRVSFSGLSVPDISIEQPTNVLIADGGTKGFPGRQVTQSVQLTFTLRNPGNAALASVTASSTNPAEFSIVSSPATSVAAGGSTSVTVQFSPALIGARFGMLVIGSSVPGSKNPYTVQMSGYGITTPLATTIAAQSVTGTTALLRGTATARDDTGTAYFRYRVGSAGAWVNTANQAVTGFTTQNLSQGITGLTAATTYQYQMAVYNTVTGSGSPVFGSIVSFTTS